MELVVDVGKMIVNSSLASMYVVGNVPRRCKDHGKSKNLLLSLS